MDEFLRFFVLGLGSGAITALLALGIVLVYRSSGVVNFAHGALALTGGAVYAHTANALGELAAAGVAVLAAGLAGFGIELVVIGRLRKSSPLARVVATLGLLALGTELWDRRLDGFTSAPALLPKEPMELGRGIVVGQDRVLVFGISILLIGVLWYVYRSTRFGIASTAVAENEDVAAAQGWSPARLAAINWMLGGALAGLAGVLYSSINQSVSSEQLTLLVVPALAASLVGKFASFPLTLLGGLLLGVLESEAIHLAEPTGHTRGLASAVPFAVIAVLLIARGQSLPLRSYRSDRLPSLSTGRIAVGPAMIGAGVVVVMIATMEENWANAVISSAVTGLLALSLLVVTGYAGQLSLAQWTIAGFAALFAGRLAGDVWRLPMPIAIVVGILFAMPVGVLVALPALRVRGASLAVTTLAISVVGTSMVLANDAWSGGPIRGTQIPPPSLFGIDMNSLVHPERYAFMALVLFVVGAVAVSNLRRGRAGRRLIAVRDNERAAISVGVRVSEVKIYSFALGSALAATGGAIVAFRSPTLTFGQFDLFGNIEVVLLTVIGGIGWIGGAIIAAVAAPAGVAEQVVRIFTDPREQWLVISGILVVVVVMTHPNGVAEVNAHAVQAMRARFRKPGGLEEAPPVHDLATTPIERVVPRRLELHGLTVRFGDTVALNGVDLTVEPGQVVGLIGPNGAGKTTLIDAVTGYVPSSGSILLDGVPIHQLRAGQRVAGGLARSFQSLELFEDLTVIDNIRLAAEPGDRGSYVRDLLWPVEPPLPSAAAAAINEFGLGPDLDRLPDQLSYARRRLVAIARAVAMSPSILLLDEPAAGLDDLSTVELSAMIRRLSERWGMGILLIEHDVDMVMRTCDVVTAINFGSLVAAGPPAAIRRHSEVIASYLGHEIGEDAERESVG